MPVYVIIRSSTESSNSSFGNRIAKRFTHYALDKGQWLIATDLAMPELKAELKIEKGDIYTGTLVMRVSDYAGLHNKKLWDWLRENAQKEE
jgi:hypothetical protein